EALELLLQIPKGKVTTYRALAVALGDEIAARAVGQLMAQNTRPDKYPCYKVVHTSGEVGNYSAPGGTAEKVARLQADGIEIRDGRIVNLHKCLFTDFKSSQPLKQLRRLQEELSAAISLEPGGEPRTVGGVDVSYGERAVAAYVRFDLKERRLVDSETVIEEITFPYIPTYLAFRELPILQKLLEKVRDGGRLADVVMVDGNGILHPRHAGIASHLGVLLDIPTIGITKSLLCGEVDLKGMEPGEARYVLLRGERVGAALKTSPRAGPIYVSPGNRIDLDTAVAVTLALSSHKLPEPIRMAHELSRGTAMGEGGRGGQMELGL
ncbi:MAG: endonuclease V, partial [Candidatus Bipolaricaulia bacterium]